MNMADAGMVDLTELRERVRAGVPAVDAAAAMLGVPEREATQHLAQRFVMPFLETAGMSRLHPAFDKLSLAKAQQRGCVLLHNEDSGAAARWVAVVSDPFDVDLIVRLEQAAGRMLSVALATSADIHAYLNQQEAQQRAVDGLDAAVGELQAATGSSVEVLSMATLSDAGSHTVKLVNSTLYDALRSGASDVHFETTATGLVVKYRIDGVLDTVTQVHTTSLAEQVISRLKVLAELDISEQRIPQDGSFRVSAQGRDIDLRVSIMPSVHGEDAVIRILDKQSIVSAHGSLSLDALGFDPGSLETLRDLMDAPYGMLLVTGPTGSGKTTTLYGALAETHTGRDKIITIEDPVEYQLPGVLQIPVNEKKGLTFARGLRSILRHDPDKIMIGEIRDRETAEIAVQSALTGHLVLTTVHANNVFDVFGRFTHMGLDTYALVSALNGIWAQRLLRLNCPHCSCTYLPALQEMRKASLRSEDVAGFRFMKGSGCGDCRGTGFKGRRAIAEILRLDDDLRELIVRRESVRRIKEAAREKGVRSLTDAAMDLVATGRTTLEEARRVTVAA